jgi:NADPH:quinone reductase-like Zn-dependent oxidoreductase
VRHTRILVTHYGGPDALRVVEEECPEPKGGGVRVRVLAAGVSLPDVMMREGIHPETPRLPFTPGCLRAACAVPGPAVLGPGKKGAKELATLSATGKASEFAEAGGRPASPEPCPGVAVGQRRR